MIGGIIIGLVLGFLAGAIYGSRNSGQVDAAVEDALKREREAVAAAKAKVNA